MKMKCLIIIPAYNEEASILQVVDNLRNNYREYDYVVVNDGSTDKTRKICYDNKIDLLDLPVNVGLSGAIRAGMKYANYYDYEYVVQLDGDGQHNPIYIKDMFDVMKQQKADIVIGSRFKTKKKPLTSRMLGSRLISACIFFTTKGKYIGDATSGMRLYNKAMIKKIGYDINNRPEPDTLAFLINHGVKVEEVQVEMEDRYAGRSYLSIMNSMLYMTHVLFNILIFQWIRKE